MKTSVSTVCGIPELNFLGTANSEKSVHTSLIGVGWLEQTTTDPTARNELFSRDWDFLILQGQKISVSGKFEYSREAGIELAQLARSRGTRVLYFSEWGLKDVPGDGQRNENIYREMAEETGANVIPIGRAWDIALNANRNLPLYDADGNHQSAMGAYLTAATISGLITGENLMALTGFKYSELKSTDQKILLEAASNALNEKK